MAYSAQPKIDVMPLLAFVQGNDPWNVLAFANRMGLNGNNHAVYRYMKEGIPLFTADRICCKHLGVHPTAVWHDWYALAREATNA